MLWARTVAAPSSGERILAYKSVPAFPCKAFPDKARLCPSAPATNSLKPWPALWPPTLAMKSQKPCSERWPLHAPSTQPRAALPTQPANRDGLSPASALPRRLVADLLLAFEADRPRVASFLRFYEGAACGESTKQHGQRATAPEQSFELQPSQLRLQAQNVSATPSDEIAAALASTMAKRSLEVVTADRLRRAKTPCEAKHRDRSSAAKLWAQAGAAATFINVSATQLDPAAALDQRQRKSLQPLPELSPAAASGEIVLGNGANNVANARNSLRRRIRMRISSVCAAGLLSSRDQALPLSLALPGSKFKP